MIHVINFKHTTPPDAEVVNATSRSSGWSKALSPFFCGPCDLYNGYVAKNVENAWQFSKVYEFYLEEDGSVGERYFKWAQDGWQDTYAHRYPMGKGVTPLYSYWDGQIFTYTEARKKIYIPLYAKAVQKTKAFAKLKKDHLMSFKDLYLQDFDAHGLKPGTFDYWDLFNNPNIKVGHAYVLAMLLEGIIK